MKRVNLLDYFERAETFCRVRSAACRLIVKKLERIFSSTMGLAPKLESFIESDNGF